MQGTSDPRLGLSASTASSADAIAVSRFTPRAPPGQPLRQPLVGGDICRHRRQHPIKIIPGTRRRQHLQQWPGPDVDQEQQDLPARQSDKRLFLQPEPDLRIRQSCPEPGRSHLRMQVERPGGCQSPVLTLEHLSRLHPCQELPDPRSQRRVQPRHRSVNLHHRLSQFVCRIPSTRETHRAPHKPELIPVPPQQEKVRRPGRGHTRRTLLRGHPPHSHIPQGVAEHPLHLLPAFIGRIAPHQSPITPVGQARAPHRQHRLRRHTAFQPARPPRPQVELEPVRLPLPQPPQPSPWRFPREVHVPSYDPVTTKHTFKHFPVCLHPTHR